MSRESNVTDVNDGKKIYINKKFNLTNQLNKEPRII